MDKPVVQELVEQGPNTQAELGEFLAAKGSRRIAEPDCIDSGNPNDTQR